MDLDLACISAIVAEGEVAFRLAQTKGLTPEKFQGDGALAYAFLVDYVKRYGSFPSLDLLGGKTGILLDVPEKSAAFLLDEVQTRNLYSKLHGGIQVASDLLKQIKPQEALQSLEKMLVSAREDQVGALQVESIFKLGPEIRAYYERVKSGERGVLTIWPTLNDLTSGFWPEDFILFASRTGRGKTWVSILLSMHAWRTPRAKTGDRCRVLYITTEISRVRVGMRFYSALERLPYGEFTHGTLTFLNEERFYKAAEGLLDEDGFYLVGGDFDFRLDSVEQAIEICKPHLVVIDGAYLLQADGPNRTERMAVIFNDLKRLAKRRKLIVVITTQLNRGSKRDKPDAVDTESIALSDVGGWNADLSFALVQTEDNERDKRLTVIPLKVREGKAVNFEINWNFDRMDFSEVARPGGGGDADESGLPTDDTTPPVEDDFPF